MLSEGCSQFFHGGELRSEPFCLPRVTAESKVAQPCRGAPRPSISVRGDRQTEGIGRQNTLLTHYPAFPRSKVHGRLPRITPSLPPRGPSMKSVRHEETRPRCPPRTLFPRGDTTRSLSFLPWGALCVHTASGTPFCSCSRNCPHSWFAMMSHRHVLSPALRLSTSSLSRCSSSHKEKPLNLES